MNSRNIMEALLRDALYTYEFDVTTGIVAEDIIDKTGCNLTEALGLTSPCQFDEMVHRSFGDYLKCRYAADSYLKELSCQALLNAYACGKRRLEADLYQTIQDQYVRLTYLLSHDPVDGHVLAYVICEDITELEKGRTGSFAQDNHSLQMERDALTAANIELTHAADAVHAMLKAGSYVCAYSATGDRMMGIKYSEALRKLYGYTNETDFPDVWESWMNCIVPEDREYVENSYQAAVKDHTGNTAYDVTYRSRRKDGKIRWQRAAGYVMRRDNGSPITCYGLVMDVDEQKKAADKIEQALTEAQIANAAKTSFLARMSHDIRTPMNGILGLIEINEKHADDLEFTARNRGKAKVAANYLLSLINDVLQLSKLEDPSVTLSHEAFNVEKLAEDILTIIRLRAVEYGVTLEHADCASHFSYPYVWGSPLHVRQIFINILSNCIKYNKKGGSIFCRADSEKISDGRVLYRVTIADTGIGMSEEFLEHLFEPFSREHNGVNSGYEGVGLGMSIVKQLVEKMDGTIAVHSREGEGSTFTLEIPFDIAGREDVKGQENDGERSSISGARVLLVEDNELNMEIAETFLADAGARVTKAANGQQAVYLFRENPPDTFDIILMDVMMPVMNGYEATRAIRALDRADAKTIPIVAMTANAFVEDIQESKAAGMNEHISKPLDIARVIAVIGKYREEYHKNERKEDVRC